MAGSLLPQPNQLFNTAAGVPGVGYKIYTYAAGTLTPKATYSDAALTVANANPVVANARGEVTMYGSGAYRVIVKDSADVTIYDRDNIESAQSITDELRTDLAASSGSSLVGYTAGATARTVQAALRDIVSVKNYGATGDGTTNDTSAFTSARTASASGKYLISSGTYLVDAVPDVWSDTFIAPFAGTFLKIDGITYDISGSFGSGWRNASNTQRYLTWKHARTGKDLVIWSDGENASDSHRVFLPWDIRRDSHYFIAAPETNGGSCDMLWRRSAANADPQGNRFMQVFDEANDRLLLQYATTASGSPAFDSFLISYAGTAPRVEFPAVAPCFRQGWSMQNRAETGYKMTFVIGTDRHHIKDAAGTFTHMTFKSDGAVGFFGAGGVTRPTVTGARGGNAALASLLTAMSQLGLITDSTTA